MSVRSLAMLSPAISPKFLLNDVGKRFSVMPSKPSVVDARTRARMQAVKRADTAPELKVRKIAHRLGLRFRLHVKELPGKPDLVFPRWKVCIFVHGCFWHRHPGCRRSSTPNVNRDFWIGKFQRNVRRDQQNTALLERLGWRVEVIWECQVHENDLQSRLRSIFHMSTTFV